MNAEQIVSWFFQVLGPMLTAFVAYHLRPIIGLSDTLKALDAELKALRKEFKRVVTRVHVLERIIKLSEESPSGALRPRDIRDGRNDGGSPKRRKRPVLDHPGAT